jgi:hypothetical protein
VTTETEVPEAEEAEVVMGTPEVADNTETTENVEQ